MTSKPKRRLVNYSLLGSGTCHVAGYTVEYVGVSMQRNGHLVKEGMHFSVKEVAACLEGEPGMRVRVHRNGCGGPFWENSENFMVIEQDVPLPSSQFTNSSLPVGNSSPSSLLRAAKPSSVAGSQLRYKKNCPGCRSMAYLTEGICVECSEGLKVSYNDVVVCQSATDPGAVWLEYSLLQDKNGPWSEECRINEITRTISKRKSYRRYKKAELATRAVGTPGRISSATAGSAACALGQYGYPAGLGRWWYVPITVENGDMQPSSTTSGSAEEAVRPRVDQCSGETKSRPRIKQEWLHDLKKRLMGDEAPPMMEGPTSIEQGPAGFGLEDRARSRCLEDAKAGMEPLVMHGSSTQRGQELHDLCGYQKQGDAQRNIERTAKDDDRCVICLEIEANYVCVPCGHICVCDNCQHSVKGFCPICRQEVAQLMQVFFPSRLW